MSKQHTYTKEFLEPLIKESSSIAEVLRKLGLVGAGGNYSHLYYLCEQFEIDRSHLKGQAWSKGKTKKTDNRLRGPTYKNEEVFCLNSSMTQSKVRDRYKKLVPQICAICGLTEWLGKLIVLHVDHINGNSLDHRWDNLRMLCPNCHSQTETYTGKNIHKTPLLVEN